MSSENEAPQARRGASAALGIAMGLSNALSYFFVVILTRVLGPDAFGAYSAINTLGIVLVIPAGVFQVLVAGRWGQADRRTTGLVESFTVGAGLTVLTLAAAPLVTHLVHISSPWPVVAMSAMLIPMTMTGALGGVLLGSHRMGSLAALYIVTALTRLAAASVCAWLHASLTTVFVATAAASLLTLAAGLWLARVPLGEVRRSATPRVRGMYGHVASACGTLAAFTALTNVDVIVARHFLTGPDSGGYGLASTFGRAMCWGTQFVALMVVPRIAASGARLLWRAAAAIVTLGAGAGAVFACAPGVFVSLVGGAAYESYGPLALACLGLGTLWALVQLWLFSNMATSVRWLGAVTWAATAVELLVGWLWLHDSPAQVVTVAAVSAGVVVVAAFAGTWRGQRTRPSNGPAPTEPTERVGAVSSSV